MCKNDTKLGQNNGKKIVTVEVTRLCEKYGNSTIKSREKSPNFMVRHGSINKHDN